MLSETPLGREILEALCLELSSPLPHVCLPLAEIKLDSFTIMICTVRITDFAEFCES